MFPGRFESRLDLSSPGGAGRPGCRAVPPPWSADPVGRIERAEPRLVWCRPGVGAVRRGAVPAGVSSGSARCVWRPTLGDPLEQAWRAPLARPLRRRRPPFSIAAGGIGIGRHRRLGDRRRAAAGTSTGVGTTKALSRPLGGLAIDRGAYAPSPVRGVGAAIAAAGAAGACLPLSGSGRRSAAVVLGHELDHRPRLDATSSASMPVATTETRIGLPGSRRRSSRR